ncbi:hypothetical protein SAT01_31670 [Sinomonas atrocyanea]|uniref:hypothetical protein n=1 Tax=Sinomonas atrocyanea TaxID=37927 RepID=UPI000A0338A8|nr:hypothetical protein [Sinomonas atrocyanea]GEB65719.1 hypothetical protein SAT01_31670 [Sinomonas atrocyanea]GGG70863.1 hypothetical protein GCM10007172_23880 [Sinomonas atrocyanea]
MEGGPWLVHGIAWDGPAEQRDDTRFIHAFHRGGNVPAGLRDYLMQPHWRAPRAPPRRTPRRQGRRGDPAARRGGRHRRVRRRPRELAAAGGRDGAALRRAAERLSRRPRPGDHALTLASVLGPFALGSAGPDGEAFVVHLGRLRGRVIELGPFEGALPPRQAPLF